MIEDLLWPTFLLLLGLGLLVAEVFLPSGGMLGLLATASLAVSLYLACQVSSTIGSRWVVFEAVAVSATWIAAIYGLPRTRLGRRVYLQPPTGADLGADDARPVLDEVGSLGRAVTPLRPSGMVEVGGRRVEAMAESGLIGVGEAVMVVGVRSGRIVVRMT